MGLAVKIVLKTVLENLNIVKVSCGGGGSELPICIPLLECPTPYLDALGVGTGAKHAEMTTCIAMLR